MSWRAFCRNLRPIVLLAVGCVVFTTVTVAAAAHWLIGLPWPVALCSGDHFAARCCRPTCDRAQTERAQPDPEILEGEGLVNDATALVLFKFALAATLTGAFSLTQASLLRRHHRW